MALTRTGPLTKNASAVALGLAQIRVGNAAANVATATPTLLPVNSIGALASTKFTGDTTFWTLESGFPMLEDLTVPIKESCSLECAFKEMTPFNLALARGIDPGAVAASATASFVRQDTTAGTRTGVITVTDTAGPVNDTFIVTFTSPTAFDISGVVVGYVGSGTVSTLTAPVNGANPYFSIPANYFSGSWVDNDTMTFETTAYVAAGGAYAGMTGAINLGGLKAPDYVRMEAVYTFPDNQAQMVIIFPRANVTSKMEMDLKAEDAAAIPVTFGAKRADAGIIGGHASWDDKPLGTILFLTGVDMV